VRGEAYTGLWWGNLKEKDYLVYPGEDGRIILRWIFKKFDVGVWRYGGMVKLAQDRDRCRALVNAVINLRVP
jgi:hypothetical protein